MSKIIEIFTTTVNNEIEAKAIVEALQQKMELAEINFVLEDKDKILRIENNRIDIKQVEKIFNEFSHTAKLLV